MAIKTNKAYLKRLKVTRQGKVLARKAGHNHYNAKESRRSQQAKNRLDNFPITQKSSSRYLVNL